LDSRYKLIVYLLVNVHALYTAATLARIEDGTIHELLRGPLDVNVWAYICRILASEFETHTKSDAIIRGALNSQTIGHGTSEADQLNVRGTSYGLDLCDGPAVEDLEHTIRQTSFREYLLDLLGAGWCLWGRLQDHRVACKQCRY
jgi:hypothetical protein